MVESITLENRVTMNRIDIDKVTTEDYVLDMVDWGEVQSTHHTYKYVNQIGTQVTGTTLETRPVSVVGWVVADSDIVMTERKRRLNHFVNPQQPIRIYYRGSVLYNIDFLPATSIRYGKTIAENNEVICKFAIDGDCFSPLFSENIASRVTAATVIPMFHFPLIISETPDPPGGVVFGERLTSLFLNVMNSGSVPVGMEIVFNAIGTVVNPELIEVNTQNSFKVNKTLQAGEQVIVNTQIGEKSIVGIVGGVTSNYFRYKDIDSPWLQLEIGENLLRYNAESGIENLQVYITFTNKFLEVQECY